MNKIPIYNMTNFTQRPISSYQTRYVVDGQMGATDEQSQILRNQFLDLRERLFNTHKTKSEAKADFEISLFSFNNSYGKFKNIIENAITRFYGTRAGNLLDKYFMTSYNKGYYFLNYLGNFGTKEHTCELDDLTSYNSNSYATRKSQAISKLNLLKANTLDVNNFYLAYLGDAEDKEEVAEAKNYLIENLVKNGLINDLKVEIDVSFQKCLNYKKAEDLFNELKEEILQFIPTYNSVMGTNYTYSQFLNEALNPPQETQKPEPITEPVSEPEEIITGDVVAVQEEPKVSETESPKKQNKTGLLIAAGIAAAFLLKGGE